MKLISDISAIIALVVSIISLISIIVALFVKLKAIREGLKALLRDAIEKNYYKNLENRSLREYERKSLDSLYSAYHDGLKGNSFVCDIYAEMREWEIKR